jgi:serine/threonine protein kinase/tetratricopeptide (TPR) repeat protein
MLAKGDTQMDSNLWRQVSPYLDEALELDPSAREPWLADLDRARPQIAHALRELLSLDAGVRESGFLERSLVSSDDWLVGKKIGAYTIEHLLGRGGMGSVWLGRRSDEKFEGKAAGKLLDRRGLGPLAVTQIRHEANFLARLSHAHIARLFDAGMRESGQPYLILEYVEGEPIDQYCQSRALPLDRRLLLYLDVLDAVAYAQGQLIVHGDVKPSNVLVTRDGSVKLVDFGVASLRTDAYAAAPESAPAGPKALTPGYAAPEQVRGEPLSAATDVYALGVLLHILVTGRHPFGTDDSTGTQLIRAAMTDGPPTASTQVADTVEQRRVRGDLDAVIARALDRDPARRYPTAADLAADIRRFMGRFPVHARRSTRAYVARKFAQRHWGGVLSALLTLIVLISAVAITTLQMLDARHQRDFARRQLARAESLNELMSYVLTDAAPAGKPFTVNELLARAGHVLERQHNNDVDRAALLTSIGRQYDTQDEDNAALKYLGDAYQLSRNVPDSSVRARAACAFAGTLAKHDKSARSEALFEEGLEELPDNAEFALDRSFCWMNGNRIAMAHGDTPLSIERTQAAIRALAQVPFDHDLADLRAEADLAEAYRDAGRYREAVATFEWLWPRLVAQGRDDTATAGTWLNNWGVAVAQMGNPLEAEKLLHRSMDIHRADASYAALSPMLMTNYAQQLLDLGRLAEAQDYAQNALESAKRAGDEVVINQTLLRLARIYRGQHDFARSLAQLDEVEPRLRSALPPGHYAFVALASERSQTLELEGDAARALDLANLAIDMCHEIARQGNACAQYLPNLLRHRASVEMALRQFASAEGDARRALQLSLQQTGPGEFSQSTGQAYLSLARCLEAQGRDSEGRAMAQHAADQLEKSIGADHPDTRSARELASGA